MTATEPDIPPPSWPTESVYGGLLCTIPLAWHTANKIKAAQRNQLQFQAEETPQRSPEDEERWNAMWATKYWPIMMGLGGLWFEETMPGPLWDSTQRFDSELEARAAMAATAGNGVEAGAQVDQDYETKYVQKLFGMGLFPLPLSLDSRTGMAEAVGERGVPPKSFTFLVPHPYRGDDVMIEGEESVSSNPSDLLDVARTKFLRSLDTVGTHHDQWESHKFNVSIAQFRCPQDDHITCPWGEGIQNLIWSMPLLREADCAIVRVDTLDSDDGHAARRISKWVYRRAKEAKMKELWSTGDLRESALKVLDVAWQ